MFIKRPAMLFERGGIIEGSSYPEILELAHQSGVTSGYITGFTDGHNNFVDWNAAAKIAIASGQVPSDFSGPLHPQDLAPERENDCAS